MRTLARPRLPDGDCVFIYDAISSEHGRIGIRFKKPISAKSKKIGALTEIIILSDKLSRGGDFDETVSSRAILEEDSTVLR